MNTSDWHGHTLQAALSEQPSLSLDFYSYGVMLRKREGKCVAEYPIDPAQAAVPLAAKITFTTGLLTGATLYIHMEGDSRVPGVQITSGNYKNAGQVCIDNTDDPDLMRRFIDGRDGKYPYLPKEGLLFPELLEPEPVPERPSPAPSCGELIEAGEQGLLVNDWQATVIGSYVYKLLHRQPITTFLTFANADDLVIQSKVICREELAVYLS